MWLREVIIDLTAANELGEKRVRVASDSSKCDTRCFVPSAGSLVVLYKRISAELVGIMRMIGVCVLSQYPNSKRKLASEVMRGAFLRPSSHDATRRDDKFAKKLCEH